MTRKTDLSTYTLVARELTKNADDMVDETKEISCDDLTITGDYSDSNILEEEKDTIAKKRWCLGQNRKSNMESKSTVNSLQKQKRG